MKRGIGLILLITAFIVGFLSIRGVTPFMPIFGSSMEPELHVGDLILIEPVSASEVKEGDIIVYNVNSMIQEYYNYPPVIAHRVIKVYTDGILRFRTKGDNTGEDPFTVRPGDLRGTISKQYSNLGFPLLFMQSQQGMIFIIVALALLAFFLYGGELNQGGGKLQRGIFAPVIQESYRTNRVLAHKIETTEQKMDTTQQALEKFASAIALYAEHLASHTSAIQGLSEASQELKKSSAEQNRVLMHFMETMGQPRPREKEDISGLEQRILKTGKAIPELEKAPPEAEEVQSPPGCAISRQALLKRINEVSLKL